MREGRGLIPTSHKANLGRLPVSIFYVSGFPVLHAALRTLCNTGSKLRPQRDVAQCCLISV